MSMNYPRIHVKVPILFLILEVDSVKSTVTVLEEGDFTEEGVVSIGGGAFLWRIPLYVDEECVLISRMGSSASGVGVILRWGRDAF